MNQHSSWIAFTLSFVLPGAGFAYLGNWRNAVVNFVLAQCVLLSALLVFAGDEFLAEHFHYLVLIVHAASAGFAHGYSKSTRPA